MGTPVLPGSFAFVILCSEVALLRVRRLSHSPFDPTGPARERCIGDFVRLTPTTHRLARHASFPLAVLPVAALTGPLTVDMHVGSSRIAMRPCCDAQCHSLPVVTRGSRPPGSASRSHVVDLQVPMSNRLNSPLRPDAIGRHGIRPRTSPKCIPRVDLCSYVLMLMLMLRR